MKAASLMRLSAFAPAIFVLTQCAHVERPPGGPEDKTPPILTAVFPPPSSVNQPLILNAKIAFSEWMRDDVGNGIFISPALPRKLKIKARGKVFEVSCNSPLEDSTTYILTVQNTLTDLNRLPLENVFNLVFSTGPTLDTAGVTGILLKQGTSRKKLVGLYPLGSGRESLPYLSLPGGKKSDSLPHPGRERPMYLIAADSMGHFNYRGIRPSRYGILAFEDLNSNLMPDFTSEEVAIGPPSVEIPAHQPVVLRLASFDTVRPAIISAVWKIEGPADDSALSKGSIHLKFSKNMNPDLLKKRANYLCLKSDSSDTIPVVSAAARPGSSDEVSLFTRPLPVDSLYLIISRGGKDAFGNPIDTLRNTAFVKIVGGTDTLMPQISPLSFKNGDSSVFCGNPLLFHYSKILRTNILDSLKKHLVWLANGKPLSAKLVLQDHHTFQAILDPMPFGGESIVVELLMPGQTDSINGESKPVPRVLGKDSTQADSAGENLKKKPASKRIATFKAADTANWGKCEFRQKGELHSWTLQLRHLSINMTFIRQVKPRAGYIVDSLPAGNYLVSFFLDENQNKRWDAGMLSPWMAQERRGSASDTLTIEAGKMVNLDLDWPPLAIESEK